MLEVGNPEILSDCFGPDAGWSFLLVVIEPVKCNSVLIKIIPRQPFRHPAVVILFGRLIMAACTMLGSKDIRLGRRLCTRFLSMDRWS